MQTKVKTIESERGWGQSVVGMKEFPTLKDAQDFCIEFNSHNTSEEVPDDYMVAIIVGGDLDKVLFGVG